MVLIGLLARLFSVAVIVASLHLLPSELSPVLLVGKAWFYSGLSCEQRTLATLYVMPVLGDALQFIIIDSIQKFRGAAGEEVALRSNAPTSPAESAESML